MGRHDSYRPRASLNEKVDWFISFVTDLATAPAIVLCTSDGRDGRENRNHCRELSTLQFDVCVIAMSSPAHENAIFDFPECTP